MKNGQKSFVASGAFAFLAFGRRNGRQQLMIRCFSFFYPQKILMITKCSKKERKVLWCVRKMPPYFLLFFLPICLWRIESKNWLCVEDKKVFFSFWFFSDKLMSFFFFPFSFFLFLFAALLTLIGDNGEWSRRKKERKKVCCCFWRKKSHWSTWPDHDDRFPELALVEKVVVEKNLCERCEKTYPILTEPPSSPTVSGLPQNRTIREGQTLKLICSSVDGSPKPKLKWFVGAQRRPIETVQDDSHYAKAELSLKVTREDNDRDYRSVPFVCPRLIIDIGNDSTDSLFLPFYRCEASNSANENRPSATNIRFDVFFAPRNLDIKLERPEANPDQWDRTETFGKTAKFADDSFRIVIAGELIRLVCEADSSKPRPELRWLEDGLRRDANRTEFAPAAHGGETTRSVIEFRAEPQHNGKVFECFARNPTISRHDELGAKISLVVLCKNRTRNSLVNFRLDRGLEARPLLSLFEMASIFSRTASSEIQRHFSGRLHPSFIQSIFNGRFFFHDWRNSFSFFRGCISQTKNWLMDNENTTGRKKRGPSKVFCFHPLDFFSEAEEIMHFLSFFLSFGSETGKV